MAHAAYLRACDLRIPGSGPGGGWPESAQRKGVRAMKAKYKRLRDEGYKRNRNYVSLCNSDPSVIVLADRWIRRFAGNAIQYSLQYHADQDLAELTGFWAGVLQIEPGAIRLQRKSNSNQMRGRTWRSQYGVLDVGSNDTAFRARLGGWMDRLRETWI